MKKKKEQNILTVIIILSIIALVILIASIIYEEKIEENKEAVESIATPTIQEEKIETVDNEDIIQEEETEEYVGEEEQEPQKEEPTTQSKDEKAIDLAKKEWGEDDTVTFNVEEKNGTKYYVAVKKDATVISWYEVDTESWEISEY